MDGLLRALHGRLSGIVNGIDTDVWDPATDSSLAQTYDASDLAKRAVNKHAVEAHSLASPTVMRHCCASSVA